jgi:MFS family permease
MKGYHREAKESMQFVYKGNIEDEFDKMALNMDSICCRNTETPDDESDVYYNGDDANSVYSDNGSPTMPTPTDRNHQLPPLEQPQSSSMFAKEYRPIIMIGVGLLVSQQFSGQPSVLAYSRVLFEAAGWQGHTNVITVLIMALTSTITVSLVDRLGRKILLGLGCLIMTAALIALSYGFWGWDDDYQSDYVLSEFKKQVILWAMFVYIAGYQVGFGPITWCVLSEIYPSQIRGQAMAFSVEVNFFCKFLCQLCFPIIQDFLGWGTTFAVFACIVVCSLFFIGTMVPETKGMSLEEIQVQMKLLYGSNKQPTIVQPLEDSRTNPLLASPPARGLTPIV